MPSAGTGAIGVWAVDFTGSFDTAVLTFRYDNALAAANGITESALRVYQKHDGSDQWLDVTGLGGHGHQTDYHNVRILVFAVRRDRPCKCLRRYRHTAGCRHQRPLPEFRTAA